MASSEIFTLPFHFRLGVTEIGRLKETEGGLASLRKRLVAAAIILTYSCYCYSSKTSETQVCGRSNLLLTRVITWSKRFRSFVVDVKLLEGNVAVL